MFITFDVSPQGDGPGVLMGFVDARAFDPLPAEQRRRDALRCFAALFGDAALKPLDYVDHCWGAEEFAPGGPTAAVPPGSWTRYGRGYASRSGRSTGQAPRPQTNGPAFWTAPSGPASGQPPRSRPCYELIRRIPAG